MPASPSVGNSPVETARDRNFGSEAGFADVDAASTTITVRSNDGKQLIRRQMKLESGHAYTMVLTSTDVGKVDAITIVDRAPSDSTR